MDQRIATKKSQNPLKKLQFLTKFGLPADFVLAAKPEKFLKLFASAFTC